MQNAFSKLAEFNFDLFRMLLPDIMHEIELGVWKALFIHVLRILDCFDKSLKHEVDRRRVQQSPTCLRMIPEIYSIAGLSKYPPSGAMQSGRLRQIVPS